LRINEGDDGMKKKAKIITAVSAVTVVLVCLGLFIFRPWEDRQIMTGRFLRASDGTPILISEGGPTVISSVYGNEDMFDKYSDGDKITAQCTYTLTTYPGQTGVYFCIRTEKGELSDLPDEHILQLREMDWIE